MSSLQVRWKSSDVCGNVVQAFNASPKFACLTRSFRWSAIVFPRCTSSFFYKTNGLQEGGFACLFFCSTPLFFSALLIYLQPLESPDWCAACWRANTILWVGQFRVFPPIPIPTFQWLKLPTKILVHYITLNYMVLKSQQGGRPFSPDVSRLDAKEEPCDVWQKKKSSKALKNKLSVSFAHQAIKVHFILLPWS